MALSVNIEKSFPSFRLCAEFQAENEVMALLGASGCGKSVTLKCIAGILRPDRGRIVLDGRVLFDSEKKIDLPPQKRHVGYLFQQYALFPNMTLRQNIMSGVCAANLREKREQTDKWIDLFHLRGLESKRPAQLSGGQQQRAALARILASRPQAILLDEPFSALDSYLRWQLEAELAQTLSAFGGVALWVSHDREEVYRNCSRICVIHEGRTEKPCSRESLFTRPQSLGAARISGCKNCFPAVLAGEGLLRIAGWPIPLVFADNGAAFSYAGVSAEQVRVAGSEDENRLPCRVLRASEGLYSLVYTLQIEDAEENAPPLYMELPKNAEKYSPGAALCVTIAKEALMPLSR